MAARSWLGLLAWRLDQLARRLARVSDGSLDDSLAARTARFVFELDPVLKAGHERMCMRDSCIHAHIYTETKINTLMMVFGYLACVIFVVL